MAEQTFLVTWTTEVTLDTEDIEEWDEMSSGDKMDFVADQAHLLYQENGPTTETVVGI